MDHDSMENSMGAEIRGTASPTSGKTNKMCQRDPITTVLGVKEW